jgi:hypothetical protein
VAARQRAGEVRGGGAWQRAEVRGGSAGAACPVWCWCSNPGVAARQLGAAVAARRRGSRQPCLAGAGASSPMARPRCPGSREAVAVPLAVRWGAEAGQRGRRRVAPEPERQHRPGVGAGPDGSAKGAGGGGSSSSLPVGTLALRGAPPLLCGEFLGWIEAAARQRGKLRLPKQCHPIPGSPSAKTDEEAGGGGSYVLPFLSMWWFCVVDGDLLSRL